METKIIGILDFFDLIWLDLTWLDLTWPIYLTNTQYSSGFANKWNQFWSCYYYYNIIFPTTGPTFA